LCQNRKPVPNVPEGIRALEMHLDLLQSSF
jgi:hypothetical protein